MPLGFERLNERSQRPNACINFIKPLTSSSPEDQARAKDFLERIAAQCYPVMKRDYISVMALEEYPNNPEFLGRNFNAGEVIQLVLKDKAGRWLSFKFVQMVMMHELAHCKQMNHSRAFWKVRNQYADHMKELWSKKYEGEGLWGRGQDLIDGSYIHDRAPDNADIPEHLCGGSYRRGRGKKRKRGEDGTEKAKPTYAERQQKRIAKKFGIHGEGQSLGEDELIRGALEQRNRGTGKPRVAKSKRGRDLRANAALARFDAAKKQQQTPPEKTPELEDDVGSETESDDDDDEFADGLNIMETLERIKDQRGRDMYKVCGDEGDGEEGGQTEMDELREMGMKNSSVGPVATAGDRDSAAVPGRLQEDSETEGELHEDSETEAELEDDVAPPAQPKPLSNGENIHTSNCNPVGEDQSDEKPTPPPEVKGTLEPTGRGLLVCPICSLENEPDSPTCIACSHVLKTSLIRNHWHCKSEQCKGSEYINAGDAGRCGLCGEPKPWAAMDSKSMGVVGADVLRWD